MSRPTLHRARPAALPPRIGRGSPRRPLLAALLAVALPPVADGLSAVPAAAQEATEESLEERARRIHGEALLFDGHNDLPWQIRERAGLKIEPLRLEEGNAELHTDLPRLREGGVDAQFWSTYVDTEFIDQGATAVALEQIDVVKRLAARYPDHLEMAYTADDVVRIAGGGKTASLIGIEGGHAISNSLPALRQLYEAGARYLTLTHSRTLAWADAAGDTALHGGLTDFGREVVREMNRLGMLVDLSHVTDETMHDALDVAEAPVIFSHSSARAVADHPRNVPDDVLRRMEGNGGVVMVNFYSGYVTPEGARIMKDLFGVQRRLRERHPTEEAYQRAYREWREAHPIPAGDVGTLADHVDHLVEAAGVDHVGIGSDFDGVSLLPEGMKGVEDFPNLTVELLERGYTEDGVRKILGGNVLRAMREAEAVAERLRAERPPAVDRLPFPGLPPERRGTP